MKLLLGLLLVAGELGAACASGSLRYWRLPGGANVTEDCIGDSIVLNGTIAANTVTCGPNTTMAGVFSLTNKYTGSASTLSAFAAVSSYTLEFYLYLTAAPSLDVPFRWGATTVTEVSFSSVGANPATLQFRRFNGGWSGINTGAVLSTGVCYDIAVTHSGTVGKMYVDNVEKSSATFGAVEATITSFTIGTDSGTSFANGYVSGVRISNIVRTNFPTVDPVNSVRGMKMRKIMRMKQ